MKLFGAMLALALIATGVPPVWAEVTLQVKPLQGDASLEVDFGTARSLGSKGEEETDAVNRQVKLTISSDSSGPYQLFQRVNGPWTGPDGKEIPMSAVEFFVSDTPANSSNRFPGSAPLSLGEQEILLVPDGSASTPLITYTLKLPKGQRAGSYRTTLSYRVVAR